MSAFDYDGRVAIITGASSGIGRAIALDLARRGVRLCLLARRESQLRAVLAEVQQSSPDSMLWFGSVDDRTTCDSLVRAALDRYGRIDILINNAGINRPADIDTLDVDDAIAMVGTNLLGCIYTTLAVLPAMRERREGWIVQIGSGNSHMALPGQTFYSATKHGLRGFAEGIAYDLEGSGVRVHLVNPGPIDTDMLAQLAETREASLVTSGTLVGPHPPAVVADAVRRAIETGRHEVAAPRRYGPLFRLHDIAPGLFRRAITLASRKRRSS
ncbi:MAG: SDR family oxidoreductase [Deltaproteobacteria bacterium]|nr:SDR family oxidoreductase [Deltaproteobacteria bacterium]MBW2400820.1 SDR family oxidoreductase [Deltaproteobacteria bacterium]MBW2668012.1 SDR family oxidoreductase [Deltaproteobacteria bacterium]